MTTNQIAWYDAQTRRIQAQEQARHNLEDERIRGDTNAINDYSAKSQAQHWLTSDSISRYSAQETAAHYQRSDETQRYSAEATREHYINQDVIGYKNAEVNAQNAETNARQADIAAENVVLGYHQLDNARTIAGINASASMYGADIARANALTQAETQQASIKQTEHDKAMERKLEFEQQKEQQRHNAAVEKETQRANKRNEMLQFGRNLVSSVANEINQQNANTNVMNAETNQKNATTNRINVIWSNVNDSISTVSDMINDTWNNVNDTINIFKTKGNRR